MEKDCPTTEAHPLGWFQAASKIQWVRWSEVCKPKSRGGLGVRGVPLVNMALLGKWKWGLLISRGKALWRGILIARYGIRSIPFHLGGRSGG